MIEYEVILPAGLVKRVHIDQHRNAANKKDGGDRPVYTVQAQGGPYKAHEVHIDGPSTFVGNGPSLSCGAIHYLTTYAELRTVIRVNESSDPLRLDLVH